MTYDRLTHFHRPSVLPFGEGSAVKEHDWQTLTHTECPLTELHTHTTVRNLGSGRLPCQPHAQHVWLPALQQRNALENCVNPYFQTLVFRMSLFHKT